MMWRNYVEEIPCYATVTRISGCDLLQSEKSGNRTLYSINPEKAIFGAGLQNLEIGGHKWEIPDLASDYCIVLIMDGKVEVHSLDELDLRW